MIVLFVFQTEDDLLPKDAPVVSKPRPRRHMGMGYILEDAEWLDNEIDNV